VREQIQLQPNASQRAAVMQGSDATGKGVVLIGAQEVEKPTQRHLQAKRRGGSEAKWDAVRKRRYHRMNRTGPKTGQRTHRRQKRRHCIVADIRSEGAGSLQMLLHNCTRQGEGAKETMNQRVH
jgi:hypothetical protein